MSNLQEKKEDYILSLDKSGRSINKNGYYIAKP